jgi:hypothetical protein
MVADTVQAMLAMRGGVMDSRTIGEPNGSGIMRDRRILYKNGIKFSHVRERERLTRVSPW